jgi:hypothetical protein
VITLFPIFSAQPFLLAPASSDSNPTILTPSQPELQSDSRPITAVQVGDELVVATNVRNNDDIYDRTALVIIEVREGNDGTTVLLDLQSGTIKAGSSMQVGVRWIPYNAGNYELRTFAISSFDNPTILSSISSSDVTIASAPGSYPFNFANRTIDVRYSFSSADGIVQGMKMDVPTLSIIVDVDVTNETTLELVLPRKMLERLEAESGFHYCVGNGFVVFVNDVPAEFDFRDTGTEQTLTIPVKSGSNTLGIVGTDILEAPPTCLTQGQYLFVKDLPVKVNTWYDAVVIARDYLDNLFQSNGEQKGEIIGGPIGSVKLVHLHENGTAFVVNRYDGSLEDAAYLGFNNFTASRNSYFWIITLNYKQDIETPEYIFTIDAQIGEVKELTAT